MIALREAERCALAGTDCSSSTLAPAGESPAAQARSVRRPFSVLPTSTVKRSTVVILGALTVACGGQASEPSVPRLGYVVGTVTRATGAPALAAVRVAAVRDPCATDPQRIATILGLLTDSLGRYRHLVLAEAGVQEACLRVVAADYRIPDDSVVSPIVRLPMRAQPESVRVDLLLP